MIKIFICLFVGFVFGYILRIREEKHERKMKEIDRQANEQALDEIEEFCMLYCDNHDAYETVYKYILSIINKAKDGK